MRQSANSAKPVACACQVGALTPATLTAGELSPLFKHPATPAYPLPWHIIWQVPPPELTLTCSALASPYQRSEHTSEKASAHSCSSCTLPCIAVPVYSCQSALRFLDFRRTSMLVKFQLVEQHTHGLMAAGTDPLLAHYILWRSLQPTHLFIEVSSKVCGSGPAW